jgi:hypothetical protein
MILEDKSTQLRFFQSHHFWSLLIALCLLPFTISNDSLWLDEFMVVDYKMFNDFRSFLEAFIECRDSSLQMPGYFISSWLVGNYVSWSEWIMRGQNLFWGLGAIFSMALLGKKVSVSWLPCLLSIHPYFWYYMNEARPYAMTIGASCWLATACFFVYEENGKQKLWWVILFISAWLSCSASMLNVIPCAIAISVLYWVLIKKGAKFREIVKPALTALPLFIVLGLYYLWTLKVGAGGAIKWKPGIASVGMSVLELMGTNGLMISKLELRKLGLSSSYYLIFLKCALPILWSVTCYLGLFWFKHKSHISERFNINKRICLSVITGSFMMLLILALMKEWPFWGRHFAGVFSFVIILIGLALNKHILASHDSKIAIIIILFFVTFLLASSWSIRFSKEHAKESYREAANYARQFTEAGKKIWWCAYRGGAHYYGIDIFDGNIVKTGKGIKEWRDGDFPYENIESPEAIFLSRTDVYDPRGKVISYIEKNNYRLINDKLQNFVIYERR